VTGGFQMRPEERQIEQPPVGKEAHVAGQLGEQRGRIQVAGVIGHEHVPAVPADLLQPFRANPDEGRR